jgi:hypothetical protein
MKTQILHLEPHDDLISARDKMGWGQTGRILLVWPERERVLTRRLDLVLIQRHSRFLGAQLGLVTQDPDVRFHARQLAIPVFKTFRQAQSVHWRLPRQVRKARFRFKANNRRQSGKLALRPVLSLRTAAYPLTLSPAARLTFFTLGVVALLSIGAMLLPSAELSLTPQTQTQDITIAIQADPNLARLKLSGEVPAQVKTVIVEGRDFLRVSGSVMVPQTPAKGHVRFTNLTDRAVNIPPGTIVSTTGKNVLSYSTIRSAVVTAGAGQTLTVPVQAVTPGSRANIPEDRIIAIEGLLGTQLTVTNPRAITSGKDRRGPAPSELDRRRLYQLLFGSLRQTALEELQDGLAQDDLLLASSLSLQRTLEETYQPDKNQPADQLHLNLRLEFQAQVVSGEDLHTLANAVLDANQQPGYIPVAGSLKIENTTNTATVDGGNIHWNLYAGRQLQAQIPASQAATLSLGLSPAQAEKRLAAALPLEASPQVVLKPSWWPRLPLIPFRILVQIQEKGG